MRLWKIIAVATAAEMAFAAAGFALIGVVGGAFSEWLDLVNQFAVLGLGVSLAALGLSLLVAPPGGMRRLLIGGSAVGLVSAVFLMGPEWIAAAGGLTVRPAAGAPPFKLVQFNIWHENSQVAQAAEVVAAADPDVVALEELDGFSDRKLAPFDRAFPYRATCTPAWACGMILYSKAAPISVEDLTPRHADGRPERGLLKAVYRGHDGKPITIIALHMTWPMPPGAQRAQWAALQKAVKDAGSTGVIVTGDFNLTPWSYALKRGDRMLAPLVRRTRGIGTYPALVPRARLPWPAPFMAIDQIYASPDLRVTGVHALPRAGSDHYPVEADISR